MKKIVFILSLAWLVTGCNQEVEKQNQNLQFKIDSLESKLEAQAYTNVLLEQVGKYLDSIDTYRNWIEINLETGISQEDYLERMKNLSLYIQKAEWTIGELEKTRSAYASQVKRLKNEIKSKDQEIQKLLVIIEESKSEKDALETTLMISESELMAAKLELVETNSRLQESIAKSEELNETLALSKAEALYRQGENLEELAKHIQLAPKKKRKALEDALEYYESALKQGYEPAKEKFETLYNKLNN